MAVFGGTREVDMRLFSVPDVVDYMKEYAHEVEQYTPKQGYIAVGSMDENWGWLRLFIIHYIIQIVIQSINLSVT